MDKNDIYTHTGVIQNEGSVEKYIPMVRRMAHYMVARLPANIQVEDLIQAGLIGLMEAMERFTDGQGAQFETYANQRIKGAMLDELRRNDWMPRTVRQAQKRVDRAIHKLEHLHGRPPSEREIAKEMKLSLADYQKVLMEAKGASLFSIDTDDNEVENGNGSDIIDFHAQEEEIEKSNPVEILMNEQFKNQLILQIERLPEREKLVMSLYYEEELNLKEIAAVLGVTESRVSQLHSQAIGRIRSKLLAWNKR